MGFTITMKVGFITTHYDGDICSAKTVSLPANLDTITWEGLKCPIAKGSVSVLVDVQLASIIPSAFGYATIGLAAKGASGENLLCMSIKTTPMLVAPEPVAPMLVAQSLLQSLWLPSLCSSCRPASYSRGL